MEGDANDTSGELGSGVAPVGNTIDRSVDYVGNFFFLLYRFT